MGASRVTSIATMMMLRMVVFIVVQKPASLSCESCQISSWPDNDLTTFNVYTGESNYPGGL
jgi:hypothetical protein